MCAGHSIDIIYDSIKSIHKFWTDQSNNTSIIFIFISIIVLFIWNNFSVRPYFTKNTCSNPVRNWIWSIIIYYWQIEHKVRFLSSIRKTRPRGKKLFGIRIHSHPFPSIPIHSHPFRIVQCLPVSGPRTKDKTQRSSINVQRQGREENYTNIVSHSRGSKSAFSPL
jgi:hypothetical protein